MTNLDGSTAKRKLIAHLLKKDSTLSEKSIALSLSSIIRFVKVIQKIHTEPQAQITIGDFKENGKLTRKRIITTDFEEFKKVLDKEKPQQGLEETFRKFHKAVTKDKYGR